MNILLWIIMSVIFILLNVIDLVTTEFAVKKLGIKEKNPLAKWIVHKHFNWAIILKYFLSIFLIIVCWNINTVLPLIIYNIIFVFVCANNIIRIHIVKRRLFVFSMNA